MLRILVAEDRADRDTLVGPQMVKNVALQDVRDRLDRAALVVRVVVARARHRVPGRVDVDLAVRVLEAEEPPGHDGHQVLLVVDPHKVRDLSRDARCQRKLCPGPRNTARERGSGAAQGSGLRAQTHLAVDQARERLVPDAGRAVRHRLDVDARRQLHGEEERVELRKRAAERVADLRPRRSASVLPV